MAQSSTYHKDHFTTLKIKQQNAIPRHLQPTYYDLTSWVQTTGAESFEGIVRARALEASNKVQLPEGASQ